MHSLLRAALIIVHSFAPVVGGAGMRNSASNNMESTYALHGHVMPIWERQFDSSLQSKGRRRASSSHISTHLGYGTHFVDIYVGSPAQKQSLVLSLHEDRTSFPCKGCTECGSKEDTFYDQHKSEYFKFFLCGNGNDACSSDATCWKGKVCQVTDTYLDGTSTWTAFEASDLVYVGGESVERNPEGSNYAEIYGFPFTFGCQTALEGYFATNIAEGLLAMSPKPTSFVNQLHEAGKIPSRSFSLCFNSYISRDDTRSVGAVTMSDPMEEIHKTPMVFAKNINPENSYQLSIEQVYLYEGGATLVKDMSKNNGSLHPLSADYTSMNSADRGVFLDSGTPFTQLDQALSGPFKEAWKSITGLDYSNLSSMLVDEDDLDSLPTIVFQFTGAAELSGADPNTVPGFVGDLDSEHSFSVLVAMPPSSYMEKDHTEEGKYRSMLFLDHPKSSVLASNFMRGHVVYIDIDNERVGFSEVDVCEQDPLGTEEPAQIGFYGDRDYDALNPESFPAGVNPQSRGIENSGSIPLSEEDAGKPEVECSSFYSCCVTATCRSFVAIGYSLVAIVAVATIAALKGGRR